MVSSAMRARVRRISRGHRAQAVAQLVERGEVELARAPLQRLHAVERMRLQPLDDVGGERLHAACHAERAVVHVPAGATGDLRELGRRQIAMHLAVELAGAGEGDMIDVEIEAHADGVGGDEEIDIARLVQRHLRVARARAERAQHDSCAAALAPHQLGDRIDLGCGEGDDRRARRQPRDLLVAGIGELGQPRPGDEIGARDQVGDGLAHGLGAEQQGLLPAAHMQQAVGEDVAALRVGGELHFVDGEKIDIRFARHRLDGAHEIARMLRLDLLLARDQRHLHRPDARDDLVVDLTCQQAQRQPDEPGLVAQHALDGEVRLAGVGRPQHGRHVADAVFEVAAHSEGSPRRRRKRGIAERCGKIKRLA